MGALSKKASFLSFALVLSLALSACARDYSFKGTSALAGSTVMPATQITKTDAGTPGSNDSNTHQDPPPSVPVGDGQDDPALLDKYKCVSADDGGDSEDGILVCHFPNGIPAEKHTICVGKPALAAHVNRHGEAGGELDYLGSCK